MRTVRCYIEMDLVETHHFNHLEKDLTDDEAIEEAIDSFLDTLMTLHNTADLEDYVQGRLISEEDSS